MGLIELIILLVIVGAILYAINNFLPIDGRIKQIINFVAIIVVLLWLLQAFLGSGPYLRFR